MNNNRFYLNPIDNRKSFYNKCYIEGTDDITGNGIICYSYNTPVARFKMGKFSRLWSGYSATTMRHVNAFAAFCGLNEGGKKWWNSLKVESI